ncbi:unnamed protein product [Closterium sp. NIES-65]|nr:unnamed protein product [Closterium sp. NIES-65]
MGEFEELSVEVDESEDSKDTAASVEAAVKQKEEILAIGAAEVRNHRLDWNLTVYQPIAGNFYPVSHCSQVTGRHAWVACFGCSSQQGHSSPTAPPSSRCWLVFKLSVHRLSSPASPSSHARPQLTAGAFIADSTAQLSLLVDCPLGAWQTGRSKSCCTGEHWGDVGVGCGVVSRTDSTWLVVKAAGLTDSTVACELTQRAFLLVDQPASGAASLADGQIEVMLHPYSAGGPATGGSEPGRQAAGSDAAPVSAEEAWLVPRGSSRSDATLACESTQEPCESTQEPCESTQEPCESTQEPCESTQEPSLLVDRPTTGGDESGRRADQSHAAPVSIGEVWAWVGEPIISNSGKGVWGRVGGRMISDDGKGVAEVLDEKVCDSHDSCTPLAVVGFIRFALHPSAPSDTDCYGGDPGHAGDSGSGAAAGASSIDALNNEDSVVRGSEEWLSEDSVAVNDSASIVDSGKVADAASNGAVNSEDREWASGNRGGAAGAAADSEEIQPPSGRRKLGSKDKRHERLGSKGKRKRGREEKERGEAAGGGVREGGGKGGVRGEAARWRKEHAERMVSPLQLAFAREPSLCSSPFALRLTKAPCRSPTAVRLLPRTCCSTLTRLLRALLPHTVLPCALLARACAPCCHAPSWHAPAHPVAMRPPGTRLRTLLPCALLACACAPCCHAPSWHAPAHPAAMRPPGTHLRTLLHAPSWHTPAHPAATRPPGTRLRTLLPRALLSPPIFEGCLPQLPTSIASADVAEPTATTEVVVVAPSSEWGQRKGGRGRGGGEGASTSGGVDAGNAGAGGCCHRRWWWLCS